MPKSFMLQDMTGSIMSRRSTGDVGFVLALVD